MAGTRQGGKKAAESNRKLDPDFYKKMGAIGGRISKGGGFAQDHELAVEAGRKGGKVSRRNLLDNTVPCSQCSGKYKTRNSLASHMSNYHTPDVKVYKVAEYTPKPLTQPHGPSFLRFLRGRPKCDNCQERHATILCPYEEG
jgi:general stress protein YciG